MTSADPTHPQPLRRRAQQARSIATFERIVAAAGELFDEVGIEATSMEAIAARAQVSIGSVYRFFENKAALSATLAERVGQQITAMASPWFSESSLDRAFTEVVDEFLASLRALILGSPGARGLLATSVLTDPLTGIVEPWVEPLERMIMRYAPGLPGTRLSAVVGTFQTVTAALLIGAANSGDELDGRLAEARSVLIGYVDTLISETS